MQDALKYKPSDLVWYVSGNYSIKKYHIKEYDHKWKGYRFTENKTNANPEKDVFPTEESGIEELINRKNKEIENLFKSIQSQIKQKDKLYKRLIEIKD